MSSSDHSDCHSGRTSCALRVNNSVRKHVGAIFPNKYVVKLRIRCITNQPVYQGDRTTCVRSGDGAHRQRVAVVAVQPPRAAPTGPGTRPSERRTGGRRGHRPTGQLQDFELRQLGGTACRGRRQVPIISQHRFRNHHRVGQTVRHVAKADA